MDRRECQASQAQGRKDREPTFSADVSGKKMARMMRHPPESQVRTQSGLEEQTIKSASTIQRKRTGARRTIAILWPLRHAHTDEVSHSEPDRRP